MRSGLWGGGEDIEIIHNMCPLTRHMQTMNALLFSGACASALSLVAASGVTAPDGTYGVGRRAHDRDAQVCGALGGLLAEVETNMLRKYILRARVIQSRLQHMSERAVPAIRKCRKVPIFFWGTILVGNEINSVYY